MPSTTIFYDPAVDYLALTADLDAYNAVFMQDARAVVRLSGVPDLKIVLTLYLGFHFCPSMTCLFLSQIRLSHRFTHGHLHYYFTATNLYEEFSS
jgi:hypothetical protein